MVLLFDEPSQARLGPMGHAEPQVNWLLTSTRAQAKRSRETVNSWYEAFPDHDGRLARRLRSPKDATHGQAVDELFVHHLLVRPGRLVRYEEDGSGPDYRVYEQDKLIASVEVASLFEKAEWAIEDRRHAQLVDELNRRLDLSCGYFLDFDIDNLAGTGDPAPAQVERWVRQQLRQLPAPRRTKVRGDGQFGEFTRVYSSGPVQVTMRFWPMDPDKIPQPGSPGRVVGTGRMSGGWVTDAKRLHDRVTEKAGGKYDLRSAPYLLVVGVHAAFCDDDDFVNALYGASAVRFTVGGSGDVQPVRLNDGIFGWLGAGQAGWKNQRLSAVCHLGAPNLWEPAKTTTVLFHNPFPAHDLPRLFEPTREFAVVESTSGRRMDWLDGRGLI